MSQTAATSDQVNASHDCKHQTGNVMPDSWLREQMLHQQTCHSNNCKTRADARFSALEAMCDAELERCGTFRRLAKPVSLASRKPP